jgi:hypothetical protein
MPSKTKGGFVIEYRISVYSGFCTVLIKYLCDHKVIYNQKETKYGTG